MLPPGMAVLCVGPRALEAAEHATLPRYFFDWRPVIREMRRGYFPYTPATLSLYGLREAVRMLLEEGNNSFVQVIQTPHSIGHSLRMVRSNHTAPKELFERMEQLDIALVLNNCELRKHLESGSHLRVPVDTDEERTFAVNESNHPLRFQSSGM
jgi:hypothetical protein